MSRDRLREAATAQQRSQYLETQARRAKAERVPPTSAQVGDRDATTGTTQASFPNGGTTSAKLLYSASVPEGTTLKASQARGNRLKLDARSSAIVRQVDEPETTHPGIVMWLDTEWLYSQFYPDVFYKITQLFKTKKIYTLRFNAPGYNKSQSLLSLSLVANALTASGLKITTVDSIAAAEAKKGLFFLDLMDSGFVFSESDLELLRKIAKRNGLLVSGERSSWRNYNNRLLKGLKIRDSVFTVSPENESSELRTVAKLPEIFFRGSGNCSFVGLSPSELLVKNSLDDDVFAFFNP